MNKKYNKAFKIINILKKARYDAYLVGGSVRDYLLGLKPNDFDITTSAKPGQVMRLFTSIPTGIKYGTVTITFEDEMFEVTTFRIEQDYNDFRHPDSVTYTEDILEDVVRRDFTINALLLNSEGKLVDLVNGKEDLDNKIIRAIGNADDRFSEDSLRILRACYFQSKLGFEIEEETLKSMDKNKHLLKHLPVERIYSELTKILYEEHSLMAFKTMADTKLVDSLPFIGPSINHFIKINERPFVDTFWATAYCLNGHGDNYYNIPNKEKHQYNKVLELYLNQSVINDYTLYTYGIDIIVLYDKVNYYLGNKAINKKNIYKMYDQLPIKSLADLKLRSRQLIELTNKKQGAWLGLLQNELVKAVLLKEIENNESDLISFAKKSKHFN